MSGEQNVSILGLIRMVLQGKQRGGDQESEQTQDVALTPDRALEIWAQLVGTDGIRSRIVDLDAQGLLRIRPYEPLFPTSGVLLPIGLTTMYTSTAVKSRVWLDVANSLGAAATCQVVRNFDGASGNFDLLPVGTPIATGAPGRWGPFDLDAGGIISASSSPALSCTINLTIDRFNTTGDTP